MISVTADDGVNPTTGEFKLTVKNPCIDLNFIDIVSQVVMPERVSYRLTDEDPIGKKIRDVSLLSINTKPNPSNLCMEGLTYDVVYQGVEVNEVSSPVRTDIMTPG